MARDDSSRRPDRRSLTIRPIHGQSPSTVEISNQANSCEEQTTTAAKKRPRKDRNRLRTVIFMNGVLRLWEGSLRERLSNASLHCHPQALDLHSQTSLNLRHVAMTFPP
jgi:hypothetical protein